MEQVYIETQDLSVGYHGKPLLKDITLKVRKGEILVLIGPNGAGKSTILKNIIREMQPISGGIYIKGKNVKDFTSKQYAKTMSVVLTEKIKTEMMTCRDVVAMGRYPYTNYFGKLTKEDEQIVTESLEKVSAMDIAEKDFSQISDGQRQRIMLLSESHDYANVHIHSTGRADIISGYPSQNRAARHFAGNGSQG